MTSDPGPVLWNQSRWPPNSRHCCLCSLLQPPCERGGPCWVLTHPGAFSTPPQPAHHRLSREQVSCANCRNRGVKVFQEQRGWEWGDSGGEARGRLCRVRDEVALGMSNASAGSESTAGRWGHGKADGHEGAHVSEPCQLELGGGGRLWGPHSVPPPRSASSMS